MGEANRRKKLIPVTRDEVFAASYNFTKHANAGYFNKEVDSLLWEMRLSMSGNDKPMSILPRFAKIVKLYASPHYHALYMARKAQRKKLL